MSWWITKEELCDRCSQIHFDELFDGSRYSYGDEGDEAPFCTHTPIDHILMSGSCRLCEFFQRKRICFERSGVTLRAKYLTAEDQLPDLGDQTAPDDSGAAQKVYLHVFRSRHLHPFDDTLALLVSNMEMYQSIIGESDNLSESPAAVTLSRLESHKAIFPVAQWGDFYSNQDLETLRIVIARDLGPEIEGAANILNSIPGFHLIDCRTRCILPLLNMQGGYPPYIALSYLWGQHRPPPVPDGGFAEVPEGIPLTIQDAVTVTTKLGFRYLWIDAYCIPPQYRNLQLGKMDIIYSEAALTIVAAAGDGPGHGLPGIGACLTKPQAITSLDKYTFPDWTSRDVEDAVNESTWNTRGWTYQESVLSRRRLSFTPSFATFEGLHEPSKLCIQTWIRSQHEDSYRHEVILPGARARV
ncbi:heterokaryon incompatibility protein-domain-containing protein [Podospora aff. communis PSN243]|uniref:Heterokaryon incompatibility protein-domain-containing protein n=1 Tax=Podospora aff. communis PSN243 TaxID=3040156 RepID=A0AAV9H273_9PEZI|nr:heterokaryon incompatibility protein-domain-containing protein [Podospora aff. communis PSN243]